MRKGCKTRCKSKKMRKTKMHKSRRRGGTHADMINQSHLNYQLDKAPYMV